MHANPLRQTETGIKSHCLMQKYRRGSSAHWAKKTVKYYHYIGEHRSLKVGCPFMQR